MGAHVMRIHPEHVGGVHPLCTDRARLAVARAQGFLAVEREIGAPIGRGMRPGIDIDAWYAWQQEHSNECLNEFTCTSDFL